MAQVILELAIVVFMILLIKKDFTALYMTIKKYMSQCIWVKIKL